ncbi:MAG: ABC-F family ATP-binding cassette domain-containing protein [Deltaproteobacteria bacterium]|nr:ABC-F family ATP-binding cassette domain-containing protein [Deltaproteobacteria bacterium]
MIRLQGVTRFHGHQDVLRECDLHIGPTDRIGLIGPNGAGKTTLLRLILGEEEPNSGEISRSKDLRIGYLPQSLVDLEGRTVLSLTLDAAGDLARIERELEETTRALERSVSHEETLLLTERQGRLQEVFDHLGGYGLEAQAGRILSGLGFSQEDFSRPVEELSGGWKMRAAMARILLSEPDLILLDEPTNHLDLQSLIWMEEYLKQCRSALVLVSHDRTFLNNLVNRIVEIDGGRLISYAGNYDFYEREKGKRLKVHQAAYENQQDTIRQLERFIQRNRARKDRARQVQSRIRLLERMERIDPPRSQPVVDFDFPEPPRAPKTLIELKGVSKAYDGKRVYDRIDLSIQRGDRIAFVGPNGAGKTTLMRILSGEVDFDGVRRIAEGVRLGVFSQEQTEGFSMDRTVLEGLMSVAGDQPQGRLRSLLGAFLFRGDDVFKRVSVLSGGEKSRLLLCKILIQPVNLLLLDEPTNHLDIDSRKVLETALRRYSGTLCLVSHDRRLINGVANKILLVRDRKIELYPGNFDDFQSIWRAGQGTDLERGQPASPPGKGAGRKKTQDQKRAEAEWRNRVFRETSPLRERLLALEKRIEEKTRELDRIASHLARDETYQNPGRLRELTEAYRTAKTEVAEWTCQWESVALELESLERRLEEEKPGRNHSG